MDNLDARIALARTHVEDGRRIVERQRIRVASGLLPEPDASKLLEAFERSLAIFEEDLRRLLAEKNPN
jgi:hypothetical protein